MEYVRIDDVESGVDEGDSASRRLSDYLGTTDLAINHYRIAPGDGLSGGLHAHADQEEVFVVVEGEATFETMSGDVVASEGEVIRFDPGEFQSGRNDADGDLAVIAIGAPRDSDDVRVPLACPECAHDDVRLDFAGGATTFVCPDCEAERVAEPCPNCGGDDLAVTLRADDEPVVSCSGCESVFEVPPTRGGW